MTGEQHFKAVERSTRTLLAPGQFGVVRLDGKAFHTYCRGLDKPFDQRFMDDIDAAAADLFGRLSGIRLAYVQSDEISLVLSDRSASGEEQPYPHAGQVQKIVSITAAAASTHFNLARAGLTDRIGLFDARAFSLPTVDDVLSYLRWRQRDAQRNSLSMIAETRFSHTALRGVSSADRRDMLLGIGVDPDADVPAGFRLGRLIARRSEPGSSTFTHKRSGETRTVEFIRQVPASAPALVFWDKSGTAVITDLLAS